MVRTIVLASVLLLLAASGAARAERWTAPDGGLTVELPQGERWAALPLPPAAQQALPPEMAVASRQSKDGRRTVSVTATAGAPSDDVFDRVVNGFKQGMLHDNPAGQLSGTRVEMQGRPAYKYQFRLPNGTVMAGVVVTHKTVFYNIMAGDADRDPSLDPELAEYLESWRLR